MASTTERVAYSRRQTLIASSAWLAAAAIGCRPSGEPATEPVARRSDVPLRIVMLGTQDDADTIRRGWLSVNEQPLSIEPIELTRDQPVEPLQQLLEQAKSSDLVIAPLALLGELVAQQAVTPLMGDEFETLQNQWFSALRNGAARYAGQLQAIPLGGQQPAVLSTTAAPTMSDWNDYQKWIEALDGQVAEPTADGWAAMMFLWRAATSSEGWLFDRDDFSPLLSTEHYLQTLQAMLAVHQLSKSERRLSPDEVFAAVADGTLQGGIGFPSTRHENADKVLIANLPGVSESSRTVLDAFTPIAVLSASCRQSAASKRLLQWLAGGEGSDSVRQQVAGMTAISAASNASAGNDGDQFNAEYSRWLSERLQSPLTLPTIQMLQAGRYYAALDQQIIRCLEGQATPEQALASVSEQWQQITQEVGAEKQLRTWRRAQGMQA